MVMLLAPVMSGDQSADLLVDYSLSLIVDTLKWSDVFRNHSRVG
jgi:hypothetical protein